MANSKSARKRAEKSAMQREKNRGVRSRLRTAVKKARTAIAGGAAEAEQQVAEAMSILDRTAQKGIIHKNAAARSKARLVAALKRPV